MFRLRIDDGRLIVEPRCSLDYPWDAYSFTIANLSLINELWPPPVMGELDLPLGRPVSDGYSRTRHRSDRAARRIGSSRTTRLTCLSALGTAPAMKVWYNPSIA